MHGCLRSSWSPISGPPTLLVEAEGRAYFLFRGFNREELWTSDGTERGTVQLPTPVGVGLQGVAAFGRELLFAQNGAFWLTRGDRPPLRLFGRLFPCGIVASQGGRLYFAADDGLHGCELWRTDGTAAGTARVRSLFPAPVSIFGAVYYVPDFFAVAGERALAFFFPYDGSEIWTTDGTEEGTGKIFDLDEADDEASGRLFDAGVPFAEGILFTTWGPQTGIQIWRTDPTPAGAHLVGRVDVDSPPRSLTRSGDLAYFSADDGAGRELWVADGTLFGARRVKDIAPGCASSSPLELTSVGDRLFFTAADGVHGRELWSTDGTAEGTAMVADISPGRATSFPQHLAAIGGRAARLAFSANDGLHGLEPWTVQADGVGTALRSQCRTRTSSALSRPRPSTRTGRTWGRGSGISPAATCAATSRSAP